MKKIIAAIFLFPVVLLTGCSVYEDLYFLEDGQVKYNMTIDAGELMSIAGTSSLKGNDKLPKDSIINFSQLVKDSLKNNISPETEQHLKNIEPLFMRVENNDSEGVMKISLFGDFANFDAFTKAFASMSEMESKIKNKENNPISRLSVDNIFSRNLFSWNGTSLKRTVKLSAVNEESLGEEETDDGEDASDKKLNKDIDLSMARLFSQGTMTVKYHFPKKVKSVSNKNATFSMDGKTVILNYPASLFLEPNNELSIDIEIE